MLAIGVIGTFLVVFTIATSAVAEARVIATVGVALTFWWTMVLLVALARQLATQVAGVLVSGGDDQDCENLA